MQPVLIRNDDPEHAPHKFYKRDCYLVLNVRIPYSYAISSFLMALRIGHFGRKSRSGRKDECGSEEGDQ